MSEMLIPMVIISVLIMLNGFFVAAEFSIVGSAPTRLAQWAKDGSHTAARVLKPCAI